MSSQISGNEHLFYNSYGSDFSFHGNRHLWSWSAALRFLSPYENISTVKGTGLASVDFLSRCRIFPSGSYEQVETPPLWKSHDVPWSESTGEGISPRRSRPPLWICPEKLKRTDPIQDQPPSSQKELISGWEWSDSETLHPLLVFTSIYKYLQEFLRTLASPYKIRLRRHFWKLGL